MSLKSTIKTVATLGKGVSRGLKELDAGPNPIALFRTWFDDAQESGLLLPESMTLATATPDGVPSARQVLLKGVDERGFVFFTNYESRKSSELESNPHAALVFHWPILERQVRIEGTASRITTEESAAYFETRPRGSQLGAWTSKQSAVLSGRDEIEARYREVEARYAGKAVPLPPFWGGFRLRPESIEFWQGRVNRLHDRLRYRRDETDWRVERLYP